MAAVYGTRYNWINHCADQANINKQKVESIMLRGDCCNTTKNQSPKTVKSEQRKQYNIIRSLGTQAL